MVDLTAIDISDFSDLFLNNIGVYNGLLTLEGGEDSQDWATVPFKIFNGSASASMRARTVNIVNSFNSLVSLGKCELAWLGELSVNAEVFEDDEDGDEILPEDPSGYSDLQILKIASKQDFATNTYDCANAHLELDCFDDDLMNEWGSRDSISHYLSRLENIAFSMQLLHDLFDEMKIEFLESIGFSREHILDNL